MAGLAYSAEVAGCVGSKLPREPEIKGPTRGDGWGQGPTAKPLTLEGRDTTYAAVEKHYLPDPAEAQTRSWKVCHADLQSAKKRGSNRSWSLNAQGRSQIAKYGPNAREEDLRQTGWALTEGGGYGQNPVPSVAGPREEERSGVASTRSNIDFDRLVSNAFGDMPAMQ